MTSKTDFLLHEEYQNLKHQKSCPIVHSFQTKTEQLWQNRTIYFTIKESSGVNFFETQPSKMVLYDYMNLSCTSKKVKQYDYTECYYII